MNLGGPSMLALNPQRFGPPAVKDVGPVNVENCLPPFFLRRLVDRFSDLPLGILLLFRESTLARTLSCMGGPARLYQRRMANLLAYDKSVIDPILLKHFSQR